MSIQEEKDSLKLFSELVIFTLKNVKVDREKFLLKEFPEVDSDLLLKNGPLEFYSVEELEKKALKIVDNTTNSVALRSFMSGLPGNPILAVALGSADAVQYFASLLNLLQKIIYTLGEENLFDKFGQLSQESKLKILGYLALMLGVEKMAAKLLVTEASKEVTKKLINSNISTNMVNKLAAQVLAKNSGNVAKSSFTKFAPLVGGIASGGITYFTFKKSGKTLVKEYVDILTGNKDKKDGEHEE